MRLMMLRGLPASGKTTYAETVCKEQNWKRVNRDLLRTMLHFDIWKGRNESTTVEVEKSTVKWLLGNKFNVIVDDCNLNPENKIMWQEVAKETGAEFFVKTFHTPYLECIDRDTDREKSVGEHVITNMAFQYSTDGIPTEKIVICDIDGTIADTAHRVHFLEGEKKDWKSFFGKMMSDPVREEVVAQIRTLHESGHTIVFVSGRPDNYRAFTADWLTKNGIDFGFTLIMRRSDDSRPDTAVKEQIYDKFFADKKVVKVFDDRPSVIRMWQSKGLNVVDVGKGIEF